MLYHSDAKEDRFLHCRGVQGEKHREGSADLVGACTKGTVVCVWEAGGCNAAQGREPL